MRRMLSLILAAALCATLLAGCGNETPVTTGDPGTAGQEQQNTSNYPTPENPLTISIGHSTPEQSSGNTQAMLLKEYIERESDGAILVDIYPNSQLGNEDTMLQGVYSGTMDAGIISGAVVTTILPEANAWYLPFMFSNLQEYADVMFSDEFYEATAQLVEEKTGMHYLGIPIVSPRGLLNTKRAVTTPEDMDGLTIRCISGEIISDILDTLGASTTQLSFGEVYTGLQQGVCDGVENGLSDCIEMKFTEVAHYYTDTFQCMNGIALFVSDTLWQKLSTEQQVLMRDACKYVEGTVVENQQKAIDDSYAVGEEEYGVEVTLLTDEQREVFREACQPVYDKYRPIIGDEYYDLVTGLAGE